MTVQWRLSFQPAMKGIISNRRNLKMSALRFSVERKHFENGASRKRRLCDIKTIMWIPCLSFSQTQIQNDRRLFHVQLSSAWCGRSVDWDKEILQTWIKRTMNIVPWCIAEHSHYVMYDHGLNHHLICLCNFYKMLVYVRPNFSVRSKQIGIWKHTCRST